MDLWNFPINVCTSKAINLSVSAHTDPIDIILPFCGSVIEPTGHALNSGSVIVTDFLRKLQINIVILRKVFLLFLVV